MRALLWGPLLSTTVLSAALVLPGAFSSAPAPIPRPVYTSPFDGVSTATLCAKDGSCWQNARHGVKLLNTPVGSAAYQFGLRPGDILQYVDHHRVRAMDDFLNVVETHKDDPHNGAEHHLSLRRDGQRVSMRINVNSDPHHRSTLARRRAALERRRAETARRNAEHDRRRSRRSSRRRHHDSTDHTCRLPR